MITPAAAEIKRLSRGYYVTLFDYRFGVEYSPVIVSGEMYLERWLLYLGWICLRLHKFHRGDDVRAPHDHPFWFITFPFTSYLERVAVPERPFADYYRLVKRWRFHFRPALFRHIVICGYRDNTPHHKPFWTFVIAGHRSRLWGFWPQPDKFVSWKEWT